MPGRDHSIVRIFVKRLLFAIFLLPSVLFAAGKAEYVVVVVWDGMRADFIQKKYTPTLYQLARSGAWFENHHSAYCTATEVNGTAIATGLYPEHSGVIANRDWLPEIQPLRTVERQTLAVVRKGDQLSGGHYLMGPTLAEILQAAGKTTAIAGTKAVALLQDRRERSDEFTSGTTLFEGKTLPATALNPITGLLGKFPAAASTKSDEANGARDEWTTRALIGPLWSKGVPALSLLWLSEPDFSQHAAGPGSPKALAALRSSDRCLARVLAELDRRGLRDKTDVFVVSDHGFSTVQAAADLATILQDAGFNARREFKSSPVRGDVLVAGQGGSALLYVVDHDRDVVRRLVDFLQRQDFAGPIFTRDPMDGTFTLEQVKVQSPHAPDVVLSMRWSKAKNKFKARGLFVGEGTLVPGRGSHASLSRFDVHNILVGSGPDLKKSYEDDWPTGNVDLAPTILWLLGVAPQRPMDGRVLSESLIVDAPPVREPVTRMLEAQRPLAGSTWYQYVQISQVNDTIYVDEGNAKLKKR